MVIIPSTKKYVRQHRLTNYRIIKRYEGKGVGLVMKGGGCGYTHRNSMLRFVKKIML